MPRFLSRLSVASLVCVGLALTSLTACDKPDEEAQRKLEQEYIDKVTARVDAICACDSRECAEAASKELTKVQEEARAKVETWNSSEVHSRMLPEMERAGQCHAARL